MFNLEALNFVNEVERECEPIFAKLEDICLHNQKKMLNAFRDANVNLSDIASSTGYGNDDRARVKLSEVYANAFAAWVKKDSVFALDFPGIWKYINNRIK